jgi:hypothetical protein
MVGKCELVGSCANLGLCDRRPWRWRASRAIGRAGGDHDRGSAQAQGSSGPQWTASVRSSRVRRMASCVSGRRSQAGGRGHERQHRRRLFQGPDQAGQAPDRRGRQETRLWRGRWMVLETWRPSSHPLIASKECKGSKECRPAACVILAAFCAIYVRGAVASHVAGKTATDETNGKAGPSSECPLRGKNKRTRLVGN